MVRPCLCGDPYCGSCGNPSLAVLEEAEEQLMEELHKNGAMLEHYIILTKLVPYLVEAFNVAVDERVQDLIADEANYLTYLQERVEALEREIAKQ